MGYYDLKNSRKWFYETQNGELYQISVYHEEYSSGHSETVLEGPVQIYGNTKQEYLNEAEKIAEGDAPNAVIRRVQTDL